MAIVVATEESMNTEWRDALAAVLPTDDIWIWPDVRDRNEVEFVAMWMLPLDELATFPNLKAIMLLSAGGNHLRPASALPDVPIVRLSDPMVARDMAAWATYWVLHYHRDMDRYATQQREQRWERHTYLPPSDVTVGILGMGAIGSQTATLLRGFGYEVIGWSRSGRPVDDFEMFDASQLGDFLSRSRFVINVLPLTPQTRKIIDADAIAAMPKGAVVINMGRGGTIDDDALFAALDSGHLRGAALDVFRDEPLQPDSVYWAQAGLAMTPHISGTTFPEQAAPLVAANIERVRSGEAPFPLFDPAVGY